MPTHHDIHRCIGNKTSLRFQVEFAKAVWITAGVSDQRSSTAIKPYERTSHSIVFSLRRVPYKHALCLPSLRCGMARTHRHQQRRGGQGRQGTVSVPSAENKLLNGEWAYTNQPNPRPAAAAANPPIKPTASGRPATA